MYTTNSVWKETTLGEIIDFLDHKRIPLSAKDRQERQGPYPYYGASGIIDYIDDYIFDGRFLLIAEDGENLNSRKLPIAFFGNGKFWVNNHAHIIRGKDGVADDYFIKAWFDQANISGYITGAAQPKLSQTNMKRIKLIIPSYPIQLKISSILSKYDDLIENNTRRIQILEEMAQRIYTEWFVHFRFPGHENVKMVDSELGRIPEKWEFKKLGSLCSEKTATVKPDDVDPTTPYVGLEHIPRKSITLDNWDSAEKIASTKKMFHEGDILFGKIRPYFHKVAVAPINGICSTDAIVIRAESPEFFPLVLCCSSSVPFVDHATQTSNGTKMPRANWKVLVQYPLPMPSREILHHFNDFVNSIVSQTQNLMFKNRNLRQTRDLLLPKLISGDIDVSEMPDAEEAAAA